LFLNALLSYKILVLHKAGLHEVGNPAGSWYCLQAGNLVVVREALSTCSGVANLRATGREELLSNM
jgi:hypothetical protein